MNQSANIEQLLEHLAVGNVPEDTSHRYALRRALLNSRMANSPLTIWTRFFAFTGTLVVGGVSAGAVVVMVMLVVVPPERPLAQSTETVVSEQLAASAVSEAPSVREPMNVITSEFISSHLAGVRESMPAVDLLPFMRTQSEVALTR